MSVSSAGIIRFEPLRSLAYSSVGSSFSKVGTSFANPCRQIRISNSMDQDIYVSFDGINIHDYVPGNGFVLYDYGSNMAARASVLEQSEGTSVYIKEVSLSPTLGNVYVTVIYASAV